MRNNRTHRNRAICSLLFAATAYFSYQGSAQAVCGSSTAACVPGPGEACLFRDAQCEGAFVRVSYNTIWPTLGGPGQLPNDTISSAWAGTNTKIVLCSDANFGGTCDVITRYDDFHPNCTEFLGKKLGSPCCQSGHICNDWTSSVQVLLNPTTPSVCFSTPPSTACSFMTFYGQCNILGRGGYPNPASTGLVNDSITAVNCGAHAAAWMFEDDNFSGDFYASPYFGTTTFSGPPEREVSSIYVDNF